MVTNKILEEILAKKKSDKTVIVSICGAADLGKSFISKEISKSLKELDFSVNHVTMDSYLMDREIRNANNLSGYDIRAYNLAGAKDDLIALRNRESIDFYLYDHQKGKTGLISYKMEPSDIIILDGLHSMHSSFLTYVDFSIFIYTQDDFLKKVRMEADLTKRNYSIEFSRDISEKEFNSYKTHVEPYICKADCLIFLESKWKYKLMNTLYEQ